MLKVAICDDEIKICEKYQAQVQQILTEKGWGTQITIFSDSDLFAEALKKQDFDLILLDIDMPGRSGLEIAEELQGRQKEQGAAQEPFLIFVTNQDALVYQTFQYHPFGFIRKSYLEEELESVLTQVLEEYQRKQQKITFRCDKEMVSVLLEDICYLEGEGNYLIVHTVQRDYRIRETLSNMEKELTPRGFVRIHKGFLVNQKAVYRIGSDEITLTDSVVLPIGRSCREQARERLMRYLMA